MPDANVDIKAFSQPLAGVAYAGSAFLIWGLSPIYWKTLAAVPAFEILMHRMIWSFLFLTPLVLLQGRRQAFAQSGLHAVDVSDPAGDDVSWSGCNWFLFIWAINGGHISADQPGVLHQPPGECAAGGRFFWASACAGCSSAAVALAFSGCSAT
jgi:chloramphenicol-sensitive protein RarD